MKSLQLPLLEVSEASMPQSIELLLIPGLLQKLHQGILILVAQLEHPRVDAPSRQAGCSLLEY
jgi:hypothetical protein